MPLKNFTATFISSVPLIETLALYTSEYCPFPMLIGS